MKKAIWSVVTIAAFGLAACGGGSGDGDTKPAPESKPRALPEAGVYLPVLLDSNDKPLDKVLGDTYRAAGLVYPASNEGTRWSFRIDEMGVSAPSTVQLNHAFMDGLSSSDKGANYPVSLTLFGERVVSGPANSKRSEYSLGGDMSSTLNDWIAQRNIAGQSLWTVNYRNLGVLFSDSSELFKEWSGVIGLQKMTTAPILPGRNSWIEGGESDQRDLIQELETQTSDNGRVQLSVRLWAGCTLSGVTATNNSGLNQLKLTGWDGCTFVGSKPDDTIEWKWQEKMAKFAEQAVAYKKDNPEGDFAVTAYLSMIPATDESHGNLENTLLLGIPEIPGFIYGAEHL